MTDDNNILKLIVFDIGGTVFSKGKESFINLLAERLHKKNSYIKDAIDGLHGLSYRRNQITAKEYWAVVKTKLNLHETDEYLEKLWFEQYLPLEGMPEILEKLRKNYKVAYLSNNLPERVVYLQNKYNFLDWFDGGVFSYEIKSVKSDGGLYKALLQKFAPITPKEVLLIDDKATNLIEPQKTGFNTLSYTTTQQFLNDLKTKGILSL